MPELALNRRLLEVRYRSTRRAASITARSLIKGTGKTNLGGVPLRNAVLKKALDGIEDTAKGLVVDTEKKLRERERTGLAHLGCAMKGHLRTRDADARVLTGQLVVLLAGRRVRIVQI